MTSKKFIASILVMAFVAVFFAQPAGADPLTVTIICAAVFASAVMTNEVVKTETDNDMTFTPDETISLNQPISDSASF